MASGFNEENFPFFNVARSASASKARIAETPNVASPTAAVAPGGPPTVARQ